MIDCFHCGLPAPAGVEGEVGGSRRGFCCHGCLAVAEAIFSSGGGAYYDRRPEPPRAPLPAPEPLAADAAGWVRSDGDTREALLAVDGLHCASCVWLLERTVGRLPGVEHLRVLLGPRRVRVVWHARRLELADLLGHFRRLGYSAVPIFSGTRQASHHADTWLRAGVAAVGAGLAMWLEDPLGAGSFAASEQGLEQAMRYADALLAGAAVATFAAWPFLLGAWRGLRAGVPGMDLTIALGAVALFLTACWRTAQGAGAPGFMMLDMYLALLLGGRGIEQAVRERVFSEAGRLLRAAPALARVCGKAEEVAAEAVRPGETVEVRAGERIPVDGVIVEGRSDVREAVLTGEPGPVAKGPDDPVLAGSHALDGRLLVRATRPGRDLAGELARLAEEAATQRTPLRDLTDRAGSWGAVAMVGLAAIAALLGGQNAATAALLVFCPCALGLAVPAALAAASARGVKAGYLVTDGAAFDRLPDVDCVVLDKTGTLTEGELSVVELRPAGQVEACAAGDAPAAGHLLPVAAALAAASEHPVSRAVRLAAAESAAPEAADDLRVEPGCGVSGAVAGREWRLGRPEWAAPASSPASDLDPGMTVAALGRDGEARLWLRLADRPDPAGPEVVRGLRAAGIRVILASGDNEAAARAVAGHLGITEVHAGIGPRDKAALVRDLAAGGATVAMLGDGINDAPALGAAHVGVAMGRGSDVSRDRAGLVLLGGLAAFPRALRGAARARRVIWQNLGVAAAYNALAVPAALMGWVSPALAALLMPLSSLLVLGNALRLAK